ncbi:hypothetical protein TNCV_4733691 [Trichonephila clavipes]|nr:hypothetical protein TNCV_4733691 [Trichonephila clavipes]
MKSKQREWEKAMSSEIETMHNRVVWHLEKLPEGWTHLQMDIVGANLYALLKEVIYMEQPQEFKEQGKDNLYCQLDRALYGLHQNGRLCGFTSCTNYTRAFLAMDHVILNHGQVTWTTPELAPPFPGMLHWTSLLKLLGYVSQSRGFKLRLSCSKAHLITYSDADFAANRDD